MKQVYFFLLLFLTVQQVHGQDQNISNGEVFDGEPFLAVNPENNQHVVIAWMGHKLFSQLVINVKTSFDGGLTWTDEVEIPHIDPAYSSVDPCLAFMDANTLFMSYLDYSSLMDEGTVLLRKSIDGGLSWSDPVSVIDMDTDPGKRPVDRPWMTLDNFGGSHDGNIYITSINLQFGVITGPPYHPYVSVSPNEGVSFDSWRYLDTLNWETGSLLASALASPVVGSDGILHIVYPAWVISHDTRPRYILASSDDGGITFTHQNIFYVEDAPEMGEKKSSYQLRINPTDPNHLNFFYLGDVDGDTDVLMRETLDGGVSWTESIKVNDDPIGNNRLQDLLWADYDSDGDLVITWRDRRNAGGEGYEVESEIWGAVKYKDSVSFSDNFRVSSELVAYDTILASAGNDLMCVEVSDDTVFATWGDARDGSLDIWFARFTIDGSLLGVTNILGENKVSIFPNPANDRLNIVGTNLQFYELFSADGILKKAEKLNGANEAFIELDEQFPPGLYLLRLKTDKGYITEHVIIQ